MAALFPPPRSEVLKLRGWRRWIAGCGLCVSVTAGCGLPTWSELIGAKKEEQPVVVPTAPPRPVVAPTKPPEPPPPPQPEEVIAKFQALTPYQIDDQALGSLWALNDGLEAVTALDFRGSQVTNQGISQIGKLTGLKVLDARNCSLNKDGAAALAQATSLEELFIEGVKVDADALTALRPLSNLKVLYLWGLQIPPESYAEFLYHRQLESLDLRDSSVNDLALSVLADLPELKKLWLIRTRITDAGLAKLVKLENLEYLDLSECQITGEGFNPIAKAKGLKSLRGLGLYGCVNLTERGATHIRQMKQLHFLNLGRLPGMQDRNVFAFVRDLEELRELRLDECPLLTSQALLAVKNHKTLETLDLSECPRIDDSVFNHLLTCKNLKQVNLTLTNCTSAAARRFREQYLPDCRIIGLDEN